MTPVQVCPSCHREYDRSATWMGWSVDLTRNVVSGPEGFRLRVASKEAEILFALIERRGEPTNHEYLVHRIYGSYGAAEPLSVDSCLKVYVSRLRRKLLPLGIRISNIYGHGYELRLAAGSA